MTEDLADTEHLIIAYLRSHPPEECMLDKISMGIGKSRATVLKYLWTLHAKGIADFREIGRNKLWMVKQAPEDGPAIAIREDTEGTPRGLRTLASAAFELHALLIREAELEDSLDLPEALILTVSKDLRILARNRLFASLFPGAAKFSDLVHPSQAARLEHLDRSANGAATSIELDLAEKTGVYRPYRFTLVSPGAGDPPGARVLIGEDLASRRRTRRHMEALLYIIRAAGTAGGETELLQETLKGVRESLVPFVQGSVVMADMRVAYSTFPVSAELLKAVSSLLSGCMATLETVSEAMEDDVLRRLAAGDGSTIDYIVAVPIIEEERAVGAVLLFLESGVGATEIESVEIVADEIASALKMQRLDRERSEFVNTLLAMNAVSTILNTASDEEAILERSIEAAMGSLGFEMGCVYLKDDRDEMVPRVQRNMPESLRKMCISGVFDGLFERAYRERNVVYLLSGTPEYEALIDPAIRAQGVRTLLILPIKVADRVVGLLNMGSKEEKHYLPTSLENLSSIGLQLGIALERSRLARALGTALHTDAGGG
ncbi:GAF domain-containing protein [Methanoculleus sp. Wushi-C6]|uniref:GAF domain-containing protein n=1 Tax=Methanoculleus caldifontis TaxID=2651577 RepID=A0ABU3X2B4_9EURY|nr:GAF domain-containing protein [Methanoculleus sp. Wushi-C6]MDV2482190.1 GAF domain-containing protein [Methanoculleus sp. Wushi-C6]